MEAVYSWEGVAYSRLVLQLHPWLKQNGGSRRGLGFVRLPDGALLKLASSVTIAGQACRLCVCVCVCVCNIYLCTCKCVISMTTLCIQYTQLEAYEHPISYKHANLNAQLSYCIVCMVQYTCNHTLDKHTLALVDSHLNKHRDTRKIGDWMFHSWCTPPESRSIEIKVQKNIIIILLINLENVHCLAHFHIAHCFRTVHFLCHQDGYNDTTHAHITHVA